MADTQIYGTICTDIGNAAIANAVLTGTKVNFTQVAVGDANGTPYTPSSDMTELKHQVWSGAIASVEQDTEQSNRLILRAVIPSSVGGWVMREIGVLDDQGRLIAIGNTPEIPKEVVTTGAVMEMEIAIYISVVDARGVNIVIDPTVVIASKADVNKVNNTLNTHIADTVSHMTAEQKNQLAAAVQSATIGGTAVTKSGTELQIPMPTAEQVGAVAKISAISPNIVDESNPDDYVWLPYKLSDTNFCGIGCDADGSLLIVTPKGDGSTFNKFRFLTGSGDLLINDRSVRNAFTADTATASSTAHYASGSIALTTAGLRNATISTSEASSFLGAGNIHLVID